MLDRNMVKDTIIVNRSRVNNLVQRKAVQTGILVSNLINATLAGTLIDDLLLVLIKVKHIVSGFGNVSKELLDTDMSVLHNTILPYISKMSN